ncbi:NADPH-dependent F420 reductase [Lysinibacillus sp. NPDC056232]|uniref:NADPH-dependent F420 reductase n=1 Tax=Lysinibacillus sp. NPDC056232 TaxID=3345756 RepID=UPI0035D81140
MKIGIIGAGRMAQAVGWLALKAGHQVMMSNSRGPESILDLRETLGCEIGSIDEAAAFGEVIFAAIPLQANYAIPVEPLIGKIVLNPQNYFPHFGRIPVLERGEIMTAELLARNLPQSRIVKVLNSILVEEVVPDARPAGAPDRRALPIAGDDKDAKEIVVKLLDQIGYDTVDAGPLAEGWRFERRKPVYCVPLDKSMLEQMLSTTTRDAVMPEGHWRYHRGIRG